jgi:hypothetical protein
MNYIASASASSGNVAIFDFNNIPQTYQDLVIIGSARNNASNYGGFFMVPNGSTMSTNVDALRLAQSGISALNSTSKEVVWTLSGIDANWQSNFKIYIANYASTSSNKQAYLLAANNGNSGDTVLMATSWNWGLNNAITRIELKTDSGADIFKQYSKCTLYGISKT